MFSSNSSFELEAQRSLERILPRLESTELSKLILDDPEGWTQFKNRLALRFPALFKLYCEIYSARYDFFFHLENLLTVMAKSWFERSADLRKLDRKRETDPAWFQSTQQIGAVIYVDLFAGDIEGVRSKIPYFKELGLTYLHLMPLFKAPSGENDGGYAVSSYRELHAPLGRMEQLASLARDLRNEGISLVLDLVFNHTSDEHIWAQQASAGLAEFQEMYYVYPDRKMPDLYEQTLREIFPDEHPGAFTWFPDINFATRSEAGGSAAQPYPAQLQSEAARGGWVWTTFHSYQWDLNYSNPDVFNRMAGEMLFLANQGVEVIRLDAVAFIWKELGTSCENLSGAHALIRAFNAVARISAPGLLFKSEAIVHPDDVVKYIDPAECQLSYNPLLMALLWNSLATRKVDLLSQALAKRSQIDAGCSWVNYVRCHDDIGWTFSDDDAAMLGVNGSDHRHFLNEFYLGRFPGSFARGLPFQENPKTGDCRISGTCASLAGLEKAIKEEGAHEVDLAIRRILLIHGLILTVGGLPLLYLGDEIGTLNDYSFLDDPDHARDSRWVHRPRSNADRYNQRKDQSSIPGKIYSGILRLISLRKQNPALSGGDLDVIETENSHVLGFVRVCDGKWIMIFANFSEQSQAIPGHVLQRLSAYTKTIVPKYGLTTITPGLGMNLEPYGLAVLGNLV